MANNITHLYYGLETVKHSSEEIKEIVKGDEDAFIFGTMGPDFLFGLRELGLKEKKLPNLMHALKKVLVITWLLRLVAVLRLYSQ